MSSRSRRGHLDVAAASSASATLGRMVIGESGYPATRRQAWIGVLLLSASLAGAGWFGTLHQSLSERHAYARCAASATTCARPSSEPQWAFAVLAGLFVLCAVAVALHRERSTR